MEGIQIDYKNIFTMFFSGTDRTKIVTKSLAEALEKELELPLTIIDFSLPKKRESRFKFNKEDILVIGTPVYAGRVPNVLLNFLNGIVGGGALAIPLVTFGNRNYDDALIELRDILIKNDFKPIGAGAFVGEHSFSDQLSKDRPNEDDLSLAETLAKKVAKKILSKAFSNEVLEVKGTKYPYRGYFKPLDKDGNFISILKVKPKTNEDCIDCKICARVCSMGSIDFNDVSQVNGICIKCCACIKKCPQGAKYFDDPGFLDHLRDLEDTYTKDAISEIFY